MKKMPKKPNQTEEIIRYEMKKIWIKLLTPLTLTVLNIYKNKVNWRRIILILIKSSTMNLKIKNINIKDLSNITISIYCLY